MPISTPSFKPKDIQISGYKNVNIINLSIVANVESSQVLTIGLKAVIIKSRNGAKLQLAFVVTESLTKFITLKPYTSLALDGLELTETLYVTGDKTGTVEIMELY